MSGHPADNSQNSPEGSGRLERVVGRVVLLCVAILVIQFGLWSYSRIFPTQAARQISHGTLDIGVTFPVVEATDLAGNPLDLRPADPGTRATVLLLLTTTCPFCRVNVPIWNELQHALGDQVRFVGLCLDDFERTRRFVETSRAEFPLLVVRDARSFVADLGLHAVPQTLALDSAGVIQGIWGGGLSGDQVPTILASIQELVPGLQVVPPAADLPQREH